MIYQEVKERDHVFELDLSTCALNHPMAPRSRVRLRDETTVLWVAWGEKHAREALANACWFWEIHRAWYDNLRVEVRLLGRQDVPSSLIEACRKRGICVVVDLPPAPDNIALYDLDRLRHATKINGSVLYIDTDLYALRPLPLENLAGKGFRTFGMGVAMTDRKAAVVHKIVDEWLGGPSYCYWRDVGLRRSDYDAEDFWPWCRINLGMFWIDASLDVSKFYESFEEANTALAYTRYFGLGEMVFTAMHLLGRIDGHVFDWRNGWNKIWPWIARHDEQVGVIKDAGRVSCLYPTGRHDVIHMSHLGMALHANFDPAWRRIHLWAEDDGTIMLHAGMVPKHGTRSSFEQI